MHTIAITLQPNHDKENKALLKSLSLVRRILSDLEKHSMEDYLKNLLEGK